MAPYTTAANISYLLFTVALNSEPTEKLTLLCAGTLAIVPLGIFTSVASLFFALKV